MLQVDKTRHFVKVTFLEKHYCMLCALKMLIWDNAFFVLLIVYPSLSHKIAKTNTPKKQFISTIPLFFKA